MGRRQQFSTTSNSYATGSVIGCLSSGSSNQQDNTMATTNLLSAVVKESKSTHTATLIFLHGLGDDGNGWFTHLKEMIPSYCKLICPNAPRMPVTLNGGMRMPSWYDIFALSADARQDEPGIIEASSQLEKFVQAEVKAGISFKRIVIGGFSQGGAVSLYHALTHNRSYGGIVLLSSWLPLHSKFMSNPSLAALPKDCPVFQCHGSDDCVIPYEMGQATHQLLKTMMYKNCKLNTYQDMGHSSCEKVTGLEFRIWHRLGYNAARMSYDKRK